VEQQLSGTAAFGNKLIISRILDPEKDISNVVWVQRYCLLYCQTKRILFNNEIQIYINSGQ